MQFQARDPDFERKIRDSFDRQSFMTNLGARLDHITPGRCEISAPISTEALQQHGYAHAGLAFSLGDSAAGYSALSLMKPGQEVLTIEMKINLVAPAKGDTLIARGSVVRPGRTISVVAAEVFTQADNAEILVAKLQGTMITAEPQADA
ncbi:MAG: PaaI family thioesterase [Litoreibacter sp.]|nr:PaaI family thioesterase [Litoreibacter sp.]